VCKHPPDSFGGTWRKARRLTEAEPVRTEALLVPTQPVTGAVLGGRYRLLERIGRGGMADVFAAEDVLLTRRVAVKIFRFDLSTEDESRRVHAEMQTLAALHHPGLVTVFDAGTVHEAGTAEELAEPYLVMELVDGPNLGQRLSSGPLSQVESAQLGTELAATLAYVHARNVIHRDVKPANILLDSAIADGAPFAAKLTDFGIARVVDSTHYTEAGFTIGTANYLSPEQALSAEVGTPTDVYSLGLVLLECLTGELAYPGSGIEAALARLNRQPVIPAGLGPGWQRLLAAATDREPANRPTAAELGAELRALAAGGSLPDGTGYLAGGLGQPTEAIALLGGAAIPTGAAALSTGAAVPAGGAAGSRAVPTSGPLPAGAGPAAGSAVAGSAIAGAAIARAASTGSGGEGWAEPAGAGWTGPADADPGGIPLEPDETAATEAIRLQPAEEQPARARQHRPVGGLIAAAALVVAALLTSGLLLRANHAGGNESPGAPVNFSSTAGDQTSPRTSTPRSSVAVSPAAGISGGGPAGIQPPLTRTSTSTSSAAPSLTHSSTAPSSSSATNSASTSSSATSSSASASTSPSSSATSSTSSTASPNTSHTPGNGRGGHH